MTYLIFDTESNGLPNFGERARHPSQPHIVQLAMMLTNELGEVLESFDCICKPDGWVITTELSDIHGITHQMAEQKGIPEREACIKLLEFIRKADVIVAFNVTFDKFLGRIGMRRFELMTDAEDAWWKALPTNCAMRVMTDLCKIPFADGKKHYGKMWKFPTLQEAYKHAFGLEFEDAHNALVDLARTAELFQWQLKQGLHAPKA